MHAGALQHAGELARDRLDPRLRAGRVGDAREVAVARQLLEGAHLASVRRAPAEHRTELVQLIAQPAREDEAVDAEAGQYLGKLKRMPEAVGQIADRRRSRAKPLTRRASDQQVADEGLATHQQLVGKDVARPDLEAAGRQQRSQPPLVLGASIEVVLEDDRLAVERERGEARVLFEHFDQLVDDRREPELELLEGQVPLAIPVRVRHDEEAPQASELIHARSLPWVHFGVPRRAVST